MNSTCCFKYPALFLLPFLFVLRVNAIEKDVSQIVSREQIQTTFSEIFNTERKHSYLDFHKELQTQFLTQREPEIETQILRALGVAQSKELKKEIQKANAIVDPIQRKEVIYKAIQHLLSFEQKDPK